MSLVIQSDKHIDVKAPRSYIQPSNPPFWVFLMFITAAELLLTVGLFGVGFSIYLIVLLLLLLYAARNRHEYGHKLALGLVLAPLIRILSLTLPLNQFPRLLWYPLVSTPLLVAIWLISRQLNLSSAELGLRIGNLSLQLMIASGGFAIGIVEYHLLMPEPIIATFSWEVVLIASCMLIIATGLTEELLFRGLLQFLSLRSMGSSGLLYTSLLFAVLHIGHQSVADFIFVLVIGLVFTYIVHVSGSLLGIVLAHGLTNIVLFILLPILTQNPASAAYQAVHMAGWLGGGIALLALSILAWSVAMPTTSTLVQQPERY